MFVEDVGDMPNSLTMFVDMKERWAPHQKDYWHLSSCIQQQQEPQQF